MYHKTRNTEIAKGIIVANLIAFCIMGLSKLILNYYGYRPMHGAAGTLVFSEFVVIPLLMGITTAWFWRQCNFTSRAITGYSVITTVVAIALAYLILKEGTICLVIVSPLIWAFVLCGAFAGRRMFKRNNDTFNISIISLLIVVFVADSVSEHNYENKVSDEIVIHAPVAKVWQHVVAFEKIKQKNNFWLFKIGMPSPMQTTVDGYYKGAGRKCIFNNGYVFDEKIVTYEPGKNLTFDIVSQPRDPEIMGHIDILKGQFLLKDNGNGTTTVTGNSWYKLYVFPTWYYDLWAVSVTRNVHFRVMEHIKELSEKQ
jgi:uncharacterized protein YndB with AHSA1/START domain